MPFYLSITQSLLTQTWYFPSLLIITFIIYYLKNQRQKTIPTNPTQKDNRVVWLAAIIIFIVFSAPYWILGSNAPHGGSDDVIHTIQTYLSASHRGNSINWTNSLLGGMDRWLLPNCHPLALGRIYALFLKQPYQLYLLVIGINVISVFIFSWKIQVEYWGMSRWMAYIGSAVAVITEGYWTGKYPDAHVSNGHGFAVIIAGIYCLSRFQETRQFWIVALLTGVAFALGSWTPIHNLPPLLITITLWGLIFWGRGAWFKIIQANVLIILTVGLILLPQFLAIKFFYMTTGRSGTYWPTVDLKKIYSSSIFIVPGVLIILGAVLRVFQQRISRQVLTLFLISSLIPLMAYGLQNLKIMPAFRWELLYAGNQAWVWMAAIFLMDKIQAAITERSYLAGIASKLLLISVWWTLIIFAWMGSLWFDLISSYPSGNWKTLTDTSVSKMIQKMEPDPVRVVGIDDTNDMHFWGQYQGLESMIGCTPFIDQRKAYFWWFTAMLPSLHGASDSVFLSIPIPVPGHDQNLNFPVPLKAIINPDALKLSNVHWIVSHHPLYPMPGLVPVVAQAGEAPACTETGYPPSQIDGKAISNYWKNISCLVKDYGYQRSLYVYHLQDALPRAYLARRVLPWPSGQNPILSQQELGMAAQKTAFITYDQWLLYQDQTSRGTINIDTYQNDYMHLNISTQQEGLLVIASTLNPYWRVLVDHHPVKPFDVNGFQTGFWVHPENTQAELIYCPPWRLSQEARCQR